MILENFQKSFDTQKVMRLLGAKKNSRISPASVRRIDSMTEEIEGMLKPQLSYRILELDKADRSGIRLSDGTRFKSPNLAKALAKAETVSQAEAGKPPSAFLNSTSWLSPISRQR